MTNSEQDLQEKIKDVLAPKLSVPKGALSFGIYHPRGEGKVRVDIQEHGKASILSEEGSSLLHALQNLLWKAEHY